MNYSQISNDIIEFTKELVAIPSYETERDIANKILEKCDELQLPGEAVGGDLEHPSVISLVNNKSGTFPTKTILLEAALDTTPVGDTTKWNSNPFSATQVDNKLFGLGVADSKFAISMYTHLAHALSNDPDFKGQLFLAFDSQEQNGRFLGVREIIPYLPKIDACFLGYQSYNEIHIGARGWIRLNLTVFGKSWHTGSRRAIGVNAIHRLLTALTTILGLDLSKTAPYFEYGSNTTVSLISGGVAINVVPDKAKASLDIRIINSQNPGEIISAVQNALYKISQSDPDFDYKLEVNQAENAYLSDPNDSLIQTLLTNATQETNQTIQLVTSGAGSVGNVLSQLGFPIVNAYGVLSDGVHASNEWIDLDTVEPVFKTLYNTIKEYCNH